MKSNVHIWFTKFDLLQNDGYTCLVLRNHRQILASARFPLSKDMYRFCHIFLAIRNIGYRHGGVNAPQKAISRNAT